MIKPAAYSLPCLITRGMCTFLSNYPLSYLITLGLFTFLSDYRYGVVIWSTTWGLLNGKWDRDYARTFGQVPPLFTSLFNCFPI